MNTPGEIYLPLKSDQPLSYTIAQAADELFAHADEKHRDLLASGITFVDHSHAPTADGNRPELWGLERQLQSYTSEQMQTVVGVRLNLNDYLERFGIGVVSVTIRLVDDEGSAVLPDDDLKAPTLGNVLPPMRSRQQILALFGIDPGNAEQVTGEGRIHARVFAHGEEPSHKPIPEPDALDTIIVTEGSKIGVSVPVIDASKFARTGMAYQLVEPTSDVDRTAQLYTCRNLKPAAAVKMMWGVQ
ncbi:hypothetical protein IPJ72_02455 [Candidatus Peregrinibacteria bacterium]|nr:MAG: hypothetical protein IPJ72_02455 [Candidatus Peregrinibacteria bacterium]